MTSDKEMRKQKAKAFFHSKTWKDFLVFLLFLLLAFGFWLVQNSNF